MQNRVPAEWETRMGRPQTLSRTAGDTTKPGQGPSVRGKDRSLPEASASSGLVRRPEQGQESLTDKMEMGHVERLPSVHEARGEPSTLSTGCGAAQLRSQSQGGGSQRNRCPRLCSATQQVQGQHRLHEILSPKQTRESTQDRQAT